MLEIIQLNYYTIRQLNLAQKIQFKYLLIKIFEYLKKITLVQG